MGVWLLVKGSRFSMASLAEIISLSEDALEAKLQTFAGIGLVHVTTDTNGTRQVEFLPSSTSELENIIWELFEGRRNDFEVVELKTRSLIYKTFLATPL